MSKPDRPTVHETKATARAIEAVLARETWLEPDAALRAGEPLFTVEYGGQRAPAFQVDEAGRALPHVVQLLALLPTGDRRLQMVWLRQPNWFLDDRSPAELFAGDPERVIEAVRRTWAPDDRDWSGGSQERGLWQPVTLPGSCGSGYPADRRSWTGAGFQSNVVACKRSLKSNSRDNAIGGVSRLGFKVLQF